MTSSEVKTRIVQLVEEYQGVKAGTLIASLGILNKNYDIPALIQECVEEGTIAELEYVLPNMDYRVKSMYFASGTTFNPEN